MAKRYIEVEPSTSIRDVLDLLTDDEGEMEIKIGLARRFLCSTDLMMDQIKGLRQ